MRKVYVDDAGTSKATSDLQGPSDNKTQRAAGYTVFAALGLTVADSLLIGCQAIIVEGASDQHYLTAIKTRLIGAGRLQPGRELVFPPAGGVKGAKAVASILTADSEIEDMIPLPLVVRAVNMTFRLADSPFGDNLLAAVPIIAQIEAWAKRSNVKLELGWKVEVAKRVKQHLLSGAAVSEEFLEIWAKVFDAFSPASSSETNQ